MTFTATLLLEEIYFVRKWWHMPLVPALRKQRREEFCEFKSFLVYKESPRTANAVIQRDHVPPKSYDYKSFIFDVN